MTMSRRALVIGSNGFIGGYVCKRLIDDGWEVVGVDNINVYKPQEWGLFMRHYQRRLQQQLAGLKKFYRMDASQGTEIARIIEEHKPNVVLNLGGTSVADVCKTNIDEAVSSIYMLNANLLQALKGKHETYLNRYVYASSSMVYGDFESGPPSEDAPKRPKDPYGAIKLGGEYLIQSFHRQFNLPFVVIRPSAVYGPLDSNMRVTGIFMLNAHRGKPIRVNDPNEQLDFTYVEDTADGFVRACTMPEALNQTFNITRGESRTIKELAQEVQKQFPKAEIVFGTGDEQMPGLVRPNRGALNITHARKTIGFDPKTSLADGVAKYAAAWRELHGEPGTVI
jgi:nucleoside-diphosphate-sugar epimerase